MATQNQTVVFDYRALRLLVGCIAFALPIIVSVASSTPLSSISAAYHTEARDLFVGLLFFVSAFLWAYNGHTPREARASKIASLAAILVAIFPTSCDTCATDLKAVIHYGAAVTLFAILQYFCFGPFRKDTKGQTGKKRLRGKIYFGCGAIMLACILSAGAAEIMQSSEAAQTLPIKYWAEFVALAAFGVAWIVAGKYLSPLVDPDEALYLFTKQPASPSAHSQAIQE